MYIAICDDDALAAKVLKELIITNIDEDIQHVDVFTTADRMLFHVEEKKYDVVFMDIKLGEDSGINISQSIKMKSPSTQVVFISGYDDYYLDVYDVEHVYFLRKPFSVDKLRAAFEAARKRIREENISNLVINTNHRVFVIPLSDILYLEKVKRVINIYTVGGENLQMYGKFDDIKNQLDQMFVHCHNSFMVNMRYIAVFGDKKIVLQSGHEIPISRRFYGTARETFFEYIG